MSFTNEALDYHPVSNDTYKRGVDTNKPEILKPVSAIDPELGGAEQGEFVLRKFIILVISKVRHLN